jgi:hypothetical protein
MSEAKHGGSLDQRSVMDDIRSIIKESLRQPGRVVKVDEVSQDHQAKRAERTEGGENSFSSDNTNESSIEEKEPKHGRERYTPGNVSPPVKWIGEPDKPKSKPDHDKPKDEPPSVSEGAEADEKEQKKEDKLHNPSHSLWTAPKGFYERPATEIARTLLKVSKNQKQAMSRLMFFLNRGGQEMAPADQKRLSMAKDLMADVGHDLKAKQAEKDKEEEQQ